jgi:hypothetical protein
MRIGCIVLAVVAALMASLAGPSAAQGCRLALVLALDVSGSVDAAEHRLMRDGLARALVAPEVARAFLAGDPVALHVFEWADQTWQRPVLPGWQVVEREEDLARVARAVARLPPSLPLHPPYTPTALGTALAHAGRALTMAPDCRDSVIDVSGDGWNNDGFDPDTAYRSPELTMVTVNALVVDAGPEDGAEVLGWFEREVLHGPAAFAVPADGYEDFERAMSLKLRRELEPPLVGGWPATAAGAG